MGQSEGAGGRQLCRGVSRRNQSGARGKSGNGLYCVEAHVTANCRVHRNEGLAAIKCSSFFWMSTSPPRWLWVCADVTPKSPSILCPNGKVEHFWDRKIRSSCRKPSFRN